MVTYADRVWIKKYDKGVPATLSYPDVPLFTFLRDTAQRMPNHTALLTSTHLPVLGRVARRVTYAELDRWSDALAAGFVAMGLKKGQSVALMMPNSAQFVITFWAILKAGGIVSAANPTYPADKLQYQLDDCDAEMIVTLSLYYELIKSVQPKTKIKQVIVTNIKEYLHPAAKFLFTLAKERKDGHYVETLRDNDVWLPDVLKKHMGQKPQVTVTSEDLALFQYTGGTTGVSKAAMASHANLVANTLQQHAVLSVDNVPAGTEVFMGAIPFFHVFGMVAVLAFAVKIGATVVCVPNARDINDVLENIHTYKPTMFHGVPALYNAINQHPKVHEGKIDLQSIRICVSGSAPLPPSTKQEFERLSGGTVLEGFGMSETPTVTHVNPLKGENRTGSVGLPVPDTECRIVSLDDGKTEMPVGEPGELIMTGPQIMRGYYKMPTETANTLRELDGKKWVYSGDIARMDEDGYFYIIDRKKDMVLIGGFNVYPANVEKLLMEHPAVRDAGVAGIPHPEKPGQEALKAWVVKAEDRDVTEKEIIEFAQSRLARYEVPTRVEFVSELPKTTVLKVLRRELQRMEKEKTGQKDIPASVKQ